MKGLILGCGYLGRRVADRWLAEGHEVTALTRSAAKAESLRAAGIAPLRGDVTDPASLQELPVADIVLYAIGYDRSSGDRRAVVVNGLSNVLESLHGKARHFVFISTTSVYGQTNGEWVDETSPTRPESEAGRIALEAEKLVRAAGLPGTVVLRLTGLYGPDRLLRRIEQMRAGEPLAGDGDAWLNLIHVDDAATAVISAAEKLTSGELSTALYLISDDRPVHRREYYERLAAITGSPPPRFDETASSRIAGLGKRCRNEAAKRDLRLSLACPTFVEGLADAWSGRDAGVHSR